MPTDLTVWGIVGWALVGGAALFLVTEFLWNRGNPWFWNIKAADEPAVAGIGGALLVAALWMPWLAVVGIALIGLAALARYTDRLDFKRVIP